MARILVLLALFLVACGKPVPVPAPAPSASALGAAAAKSTVTVVNDTGAPAIVYVAFGADSVVLPATWAFCTSQPPAPLSCSFALPEKGEQVLPLGGQYLNATMAFNAPVNCGSTKAEVNVNNPGWFDVLDVSLVDGFSNAVEIQTGGGPVLMARAREGNEKALGVYPLGCDVCVARQYPPCGMTPGRDGCKAGSQYAPDVPCQWQGAVKGGGTAVRVVLVAP